MGTDGRWENTSIPTVNDEFYENHGIDPDQLWFPDDARSWLSHGASVHVVSPYGLLRSPWNWNPSPYVTRFNNLNGIADISYMPDAVIQFYNGVHCTDFSSFLKNQVDNQPLFNFLHFAEDGIHGNIHFTIGGAGGDHASEVVSNHSFCHCDVNSTLMLFIECYLEK